MSKGMDKSNLHPFVQCSGSTGPETWMVIFRLYKFLKTMDFTSTPPLFPGPSTRICQNWKNTMHWSFPPFISSNRVDLINESVKSIFIPVVQKGNKNKVRDKINPPQNNMGHACKLMAPKLAELVNTKERKLLIPKSIMIVLSGIL